MSAKLRVPLSQSIPPFLEARANAQLNRLRPTAQEARPHCSNPTELGFGQRKGMPNFLMQVNKETSRPVILADHGCEPIAYRPTTHRER